MTKDEIRDRLVELILTTPPFALVERSACGKATTSNSALWAKHIASHLIANGVTFAEWIPVSERLPKSEKAVLVSALDKTFGQRHTLKVAHIGHHEFTTEEYGWQEYEGETEYDEENDCFWIPECWYEVNSVEDNGNWIIDSDYDVTHWMPLPEPPKEVE